MLEETSQRNAELNDKLQHETAELDDIKTAAAVAEAVKLDEIENERRRCAEEVATLQQLMKGGFFVPVCNLLQSLAYRSSDSGRLLYFGRVISFFLSTDFSTSLG